MNAINRHFKCLRKKVLATQSKANKFMKNNHYEEWANKLLNAYECPYCSSWHIGHVKKR